MRGVVVTAEMTARDVLGRRSVVLLLVLVPLTFYLARRSDAAGQSIRFACLGLAWALSTVSLFTTNSVKPLEPRLRLAGFRTGSLLWGRLLALTGLAVGISLVYAALIYVDQDAVHPWSVTAALVVSAVVSVPLGTVVGTLIPRDLEGMLVLIMIIGLQTIIDPARRIAELLPLWGTRELITYAVDDQGDLTRAFLHSVGYASVMVAIGTAIAMWRLRRRGHLRALEPAAA